MKGITSKLKSALVELNSQISLAVKAEQIKIRPNIIRIKCNEIH